MRDCEGQQTTPHKSISGLVATHVVLYWRAIRGFNTVALGFRRPVSSSRSRLLARHVFSTCMLSTLVQPSCYVSLASAVCLAQVRLNGLVHADERTALKVRRAAGFDCVQTLFSDLDHPNCAVCGGGEVWQKIGPSAGTRAMSFGLEVLLHDGGKGNGLFKVSKPLYHH